MSNSDAEAEVSVDLSALLVTGSLWLIQAWACKQALARVPRRRRPIVSPATNAWAHAPKFVELASLKWAYPLEVSGSSSGGP